MAEDPEAETRAKCEHIIKAVEAYMAPFITNGTVDKLDCAITKSMAGRPSGVAVTWIYTPTESFPQPRTGYWWIDTSGRAFEAGRHTSSLNVLTDKP